MAIRHHIDPYSCQVTNAVACKHGKNGRLGCQRAPDKNSKLFTSETSNYSNKVLNITVLCIHEVQRGVGAEPMLCLRSLSCYRVKRLLWLGCQTASEFTLTNSSGVEFG